MTFNLYETQVAALITDGCSNREIARRLGRTEVAIRQTIVRIMDKTGFGSRVQIAVFYAIHGELVANVEFRAAGRRHEKPGLFQVSPAAERGETPERHRRVS